MPADLVHDDNPALARVARKTTPAAALAALGIVYGDLGTSPLYTLQAVVGATGGHFSSEAALGADGGASGGWSTSNGPSGAALSVAPASCRSANFACRGVDCCCVGSAMVVRSGALIEAVASRLWKVETFGWFRTKAVIVHKITGTAMTTANRMMIRLNNPT